MAETTMVAGADPSYRVRPFWEKTSAAASTFAFPVVLYGCALLAIWGDFVNAMAKTKPNEEIFVWRQYGVAIGDYVFYAAGLWLIHIVIILAWRSSWKAIPTGFRGITSAGVAAITLAFTQLFRVLHWGPDAFVVAMAFDIAATLALPSLVRRVVTVRS